MSLSNRLRELLQPSSAPPTPRRVDEESSTAAAAATSRQKRRREEDDEESSSVSKRARHDNMPPPPPQVVREEETADEPPMPPTFTSLEEGAENAIDQFMNRALYGANTHRSCLLCDFNARYERAAAVVGSDEVTVLQGTDGYRLMLVDYANNPYRTLRQKAQSLCDIAMTHIWKPAKNAMPHGEDPPHIPRPTVRTMMEHLVLFNFDPIAINLECMTMIQKLMYATADGIMSEGRLDPLAGKLLLQSAVECSKIADKQARLAGGVGNLSLTLDPQKTRSFMSTRPFDTLRAQANSETNLLGGATATDNAATVQNIAAQRPTFDILSDEEDEEDS